MANSLTKLADAVAVVPEKPPATVKPLPVKTNGNLIYWQVTVGGYRLIWPGGRLDLRFGPNGTWTVKGNIGTVNYQGTRNSLEAAFKVADQLLYDKDKDIWMKCNASIVLQAFQDDLTHL